MRTWASSASLMEPEIGFARAVRIGSQIAVSGTAPIGTDGANVGLGDVAAQTRRCFEIAFDALAELDAAPSDVIRTRIMLRDIEEWCVAAAVHGELFSEIRPACTFVEVSRFIDEAWLVEVEVDAVV